MRVVDWYLGLDSGRKIVVGLLVAAALFLASYFVTLLILSPSEPGPAQAGATRPEVTRLEATRSSSPTPDIDLKISSARWEGNEAVVEGSWKGDVSSVHCDLLQGGSEGSVTDWWDRGVSAEMSWSKRTFTQEFVKARGREIKDPIDPSASYGVACWAQFSGGWSTGKEAPVQGTPPADQLHAHRG